MEESIKERGYLFAYPAVYRWFSGIGALVFLALGALSWACRGEDVRPWLPVFLLAGAAVYGCTWFVTQGHVLLGERAITLLRLGRAVRIEYAQITALEERLFAQAVIVRGGGKSIWVERQLEGFSLFRDLLTGALPAEQGGAQPHLTAEQREGAS